MRTEFVFTKSQYTSRSLLSDSRERISSLHRLHLASHPARSVRSVDAASKSKTLGAQQTLVRLGCPLILARSACLGSSLFR